MAKRPNQRLIAHEQGESGAEIEAEFQDRSGLQEDIDNEENEFAQAFGQDTDDVKFYFDMHRIREGTNKRPFLFKGTRADLPNIEAKLLQQYGSGDFEVRIWKEEGGKKFLHRKMTIAVEAPIGVTVTATGQLESPAVLVALQNMHETQRTLLERLSVQQTPAAPRPPMSATEIATLITAAAAAAGTLKTLFTPTPTQNANPFEMMTGIIDIIKGANDDGREKGVLDLVSDFIKSPMAEKLSEAIGTIQLQPNQQPRLALPYPDQGATQPARIQPPQFTEQQIMEHNARLNAPGTGESQLQQAARQSKPIDQNAQLRGFLQFLVTKAMKGSEPELYADWILDQDEFAPFLPMLKQFGAIEMLTAIEPTIAPHRFWFELLLAALLTDEEEQPQEEIPGIAETSNVSGLRTAAEPDNPNT